MRRLALTAFTALAGLLAATGAAHATDVGVSIGISQPGVYGRIDIGRFPQPAVVVQQPVWVQQPRMVVAQPAEPVYLWVPPGHRKNWRRHCARYNACGAPVMFVQDRWYRDNVYRPHAVQRPVQRPVLYAPGPEPQRYDGHDRRPHEGRGNGNGNGNGRGQGRGHDRDQGPGRGRD